MELRSFEFVRIFLVVFLICGLIGFSLGKQYFWQLFSSEKSLVVEYVPEEGESSDSVENPFYEEESVVGLVDFVEEEVVVSNLALITNPSWVWPTNASYVITSNYGYRWGRLHAAIDIYSAYGSDVYAANSGVVVNAVGGCTIGNTSCNGGRGNYVIIQHYVNDYYTIYMHLKDIQVVVNQSVAYGGVIGTLGNTGSVVPVPTASSPYNGTHLHFGVYVGHPLAGGKSFDPLTLY